LFLSSKQDSNLLLSLAILSLAKSPIVGFSIFLGKLTVYALEVGTAVELFLYFSSSTIKFFIATHLFLEDTLSFC